MRAQVKPRGIITDLSRHTALPRAQNAFIITYLGEAGVVLSDNICSEFQNNMSKGIYMDVTPLFGFHTTLLL